VAKYQSEVFRDLEEMAMPDGIHHPMPILFTLAETAGIRLE
jgi:hypothetical protein